jgi:GT2 family glycosyltransferase
MIFVIVLNWNNWKDTIECLESIFRSEVINFRIVLVDNNSSDGSVENIISYLEGNLSPLILPSSPLRANPISHMTRRVPYVLCSEDESLNIYQKKDFEKNTVIIISNDGNYGFAGGNNIGIRCAMNFEECRYVWLLNNDTVIKPDACSHLITIMNGDENVGMTGSVLLYYNQPEIIQALGGGKFYPLLGLAKLHMKNIDLKILDSIPSTEIEKKLDYLMGASILLRREMLETVGLFDDRYFLFTEEVDLAHRARLMGWKLSVSKKSYVFHKDSSSTKNNQNLYFYLLAKSNILFIIKHYSKWHLFTAIPSMVFNTLRLSFNMGNMFSTLKGISHACARR